MRANPATRDCGSLERFHRSTRAEHNREGPNSESFRLAKARAAQPKCHARLATFFFFGVN